MTTKHKMDYQDMSEMAGMADDSQVADITRPEASMLDRARKDILDKGDMLEIFRYLLDEPFPKNDKRREIFPISTGKGVGTTFFNEFDESKIMSNLEISSILYSMNSPRSEKKPEDFIQLNELKIAVLQNIRKSQGFSSNRVNLLTLFSTIFKHNIHTMTDATPRGGFMGGLGKMFGKI